MYLQAHFIGQGSHKIESYFQNIFSILPLVTDPIRHLLGQKYPQSSFLAVGNIPLQIRSSLHQWVERTALVLNLHKKNIV